MGSGGAVSLARVLHGDFVLEGRTRSQIEREARERSKVVASLGEPGSVVAVPASDPAGCLSWLDACWRAGRAPLPRAAIAAPELLPLVAEGEASLVLATSGSTGAPKYACFDVDAVARSARRIAAYLALSPADVVAIAQPLEHGYGLVGQLFAALGAGARVVWARRAFAEEQAQVVDIAGATVISSIAFTLARLVNVGLRGERLRVVASAGGPLPAATATRLLDAFPRATVWNQYGCTEAGPRLTACASTDDAFERGSVGCAIEGVTLEILDGGEIAFTSDAQMKGYLGDDTATAAARAFFPGHSPARPTSGWKTGDTGRIDASGAVFVTGRVDDVVKHRGAKVSLAQVARAIEACGARAAFASLAGREDDPELLAVYEADADVPRRALYAHLPLESVPARIVRVAGIPRLPGGKIDRGAARALIGTHATVG
jgi:acyl-coenzyme A synthetase/AMP-(fatty) acid ligase